MFTVDRELSAEKCQKQRKKEIKRKGKTPQPTHFKNHPIVNVNHSLLCALSIEKAVPVYECQKNMT